jgi:hypothetical protein
VPANTGKNTAEPSTNILQHNLVHRRGVCGYCIALIKSGHPNSGHKRRLRFWFLGFPAGQTTTAFLVSIMLSDILELIARKEDDTVPLLDVDAQQV